MAVALEDSSLDLAAYYQRLENFVSFLRAHDGEELWDFPAELASYHETMENLEAWLAALLQQETDLPSWLAAYPESMSKNLSADLDVKARAFEFLMAGLQAAKAGLGNLATILTAADGSVLDNMAAFLAATDGTTMTDFGLYLKAIQSIPAFRSVTAQRVSSVIHELD